MPAIQAQHFKDKSSWRLGALRTSRALSHKWIHLTGRVTVSFHARQHRAQLAVFSGSPFYKDVVVTTVLEEHMQGAALSVRI